MNVKSFNKRVISTVAIFAVAIGFNLNVRPAQDALAVNTIFNSRYYDYDVNGTVDAITFAMDENVTACAYEAGDWTINTAGTINVTAITGLFCTGTDNFLRIFVTADANKTGGATNPVISYANQGTLGSVTLTSGAMTAKANVDSFDAAAPTLLSVAKALGGSANAINLTYTETVTITAGASSATSGDMTTAGTIEGFGSFATAGNVTVPTTLNLLSSGGANVTINVAGNTGGYMDSTSTTEPSGVFTPVASAAVVDAMGLQVNIVVTQTASGNGTWDLVKPQLFYIWLEENLTFPAFENGTIDQVQLGFTQPVRDSSFTNADGTLVDGVAGADTGTFVTGGVANDAAMYFRRTVDTTKIDTAAGAADFIYSGATTKITDIHGNLLDMPTDGQIASGDWAETDSARPVMMSVDFTKNGASDAIQITYSEPVVVSTDGAGNGALTAGGSVTSTSTMGALTVAGTLAGIGSWGPGTDMATNMAAGNTVALDGTGKILTVSFNTQAGSYFNAGSNQIVGDTISPLQDANRVKDAAGNPVANVTSVVSTTSTAWDVAAPTFAIQYFSDGGLTNSLGNNPVLHSTSIAYIEITSSEALTAVPTISIDAEGTANDVTDAATVAVAGNVYKYTRNIASDAAAIGAVLENISLTGADAAGNAATNANPTNEALKAAYTDTVAPTVTNVTSSHADGTFVAGELIPINVTFSEIVNVTGVPQLYLRTAPAGTTQTLYASGTGTNTLTFNYTVGVSNITADLDYFATDSLLLAGGTITDVTLNNAVLTLPAPGAAGSLGANKAIVIEQIPDFTNLLPGAGGSIKTANVGYSLSKAIASGTVTYTRTGGTADAGSPWVQALAGAELNAGAHALAALTNAPTLVDGAIYSISWNGTDASGHAAITRTNAGITFDTTAPVLTEVTPVPASSTNTTPSYTFNSTEAGDLDYAGDCSSATVTAVVGSNTVVFNALALGTHSNCTITVTDASWLGGNASVALPVTAFTIASAAVACNDGVDNDADGLVDFPNDPGCASSVGATEVSVVSSGGGGGGGGSANVVSNSNTSTSLVPSIIGTVSGNQTYSRPVVMSPSTISVNAENNTRTALVTANGTLTLRPNVKSTISLIIPPNTTVTGPVGWSGQIDPPVFTTMPALGIKGAEIVGTDERLYKAKVAAFVKVGAKSANLNFSNDVTLVIPLNLPDGTVLGLDVSGDGLIWTPQGTAVVEGGKLMVKTNHLTFFAVENNGGVAHQAKSQSKFTDIAGHWAEAIIQRIASLGIVKGKSETIFAPSDNVTRAEMTKIALLAFGIAVPETVSAKPFADVNVADWYAPYMVAAKQSGVLTGSSYAKILPNEPLSRAETLKILLLAAKVKLGGAAVTFKDTSAVAWYAKYLTFAVGNGIVSGYPDGTFKPKNPVTRAEAAKMTVNTMDLGK